ncbi:hypothetical protein TW80_17300 [Loktanella sp. S4079]|nr:hypothetical protein TW80_17300 [Loktanella sp. S4079]
MQFSSNEAELFNELIVQTLYGCTSVRMPDRVTDVNLRNSYVGGIADMSDFIEIRWMMRRMGIMSSDLTCKYSEKGVRDTLGANPGRFNIDLLWVMGAFCVSNLHFQKNDVLDSIRKAKPTDSFTVPPRLTNAFQLMEACGFVASTGSSYRWTEKASPIMCSLGTWPFFLEEGQAARTYILHMLETMPEQFRAFFKPSKDSWWPEVEVGENAVEKAVWCVSNHWYREAWHLEGAIEETNRKHLSYGFSIATDLADWLNAVFRGELTN